MLSKQGANYKTNDAMSGKIQQKDFEKGQFIFFNCDILSSLVLHLIKSSYELSLQDQHFFFFLFFFLHLPLIYFSPIYSNKYFSIGLFYFQIQFRLVILKVWSPDQLYQHLLGTCRNAHSQTESHMDRNRNSGRWTQQSVLSSLPENSHASASLRTSG